MIRKVVTSFLVYRMVHILRKKYVNRMFLAAYRF